MFLKKTKLNALKSHNSMCVRRKQKDLIETTSGNQNVNNKQIKVNT